MLNKKNRTFYVLLILLCFGTLAYFT